VCFVDTGIAVSLIKSSSLNTLKFASRARKARSLVGVTGAVLDTIEELDLKVAISPSLKMIHRFTVTSSCPFPGDVLLGIDFLRRFKFSLFHDPSTSKCGLRIYDERFRVTFTDKALAEAKSPINTVDIKHLFGAPPISYTRIKRVTIVPSQTGKFVPVTISRLSGPDCDVIIHGYLGEFVIPKVIIKTNRGNARIWLVNLLNEDVKIHAGCILTSVEEITETRFDQLCLTEVNDDNQASRSSLFTDLNLDHLPSNQKDKLKSMLMSHKRLFDGEKGDLGIVPGIYIITFPLAIPRL